MKLRNLFILAIIGILLISFSFAQPNVSNEDLDDLKKITSIATPDKWDDLLQTWKQKILSNSVILSMDSFLTKINFVFLFLLGENYTFSLFFFFILLLWLFFFFQFKKILGFSIFSNKWVALLISFGLTIVLSQLGLYALISNFLVTLIRLPKVPWLGIVVFGGVIFALVFIASINRIIEKKLKKNKEILEKEKEKISRNILEKFAGGLKEGFKR